MAVASNNALLGVGRLNAFRLNYLEAGLKKVRDRTLAITLDGVPLKVRLGSVQIHDVINDAPNTATLTVDDATPPTVGGRLKVVLGVDPKYVLFVGTLQAARQSYVGRVHADAWDCEAIDDTARADWLRPFGAWQNVSASTVAQQIVSGFMPGFSSAGVQLGLPPVTVFLDGTERVNGALRLLAKLIGGYFYVEDYTLHLFQGDEPGANPDDVTGAGLLEEPRLTATSDDSQIRTRCFGKGHAETTLEACTVGETRIPIETAVMFNPAGGKAISEWQRLTYTGVSLGSAGALIGPGVTPSAAPVVAPSDGSGVDPGAHQYAYTWVTAAGQTLPSPLAAITVPSTVAIPAPVLDRVYNDTGGYGPLAGTVCRYVLYVVNAATPQAGSAASNILTLNANGNWARVQYRAQPSMAGLSIAVYRSDNNGPWTAVTGAGPYGSVVLPDTPQDLIDAYYGAMTGGAQPVFPTLYPPGRVAISGVAVGPSGVTARKIYRSTANTTPLKLLATWADNTTTSGIDNLADSTLGVAPPATDGSGLQMAAGQVLPGTPTLPVSGTGWALPAPGGWAILGNGQQIIRYTGVSGNTITGIPATGPGALVAAVNYNTTITGAPMLLGVNTVGYTGLAAALIKGAPINIWVQVDDPGAQAALAARVGGSGIVEHLIVDERRGEPSLIALCNADLALYGRPIVTLRYTTFDPKSKSGRPVRVHLAQPAIDQTLVIQDVTIATGTGPVKPRFTVTASSIRTSLEDLLRRMVGTLEEGF